MDWKEILKPKKYQYIRFAGEITCIGCLYYLRHFLSLSIWPHLIIVFASFVIIYGCALYEGKYS